jgi:cyclophilin family peptidyl-prolyl cis-trans isomerase
MSTSRRHFLAGLAGLGLAGCQGSQAVARRTPAKPANSPAKDSNSEIRQVSATGRDLYFARLETTKGDVLIEVHPEWAPRGAKRFRELIEAGFYDGCKFFRVLDGFMAQVGMNGDPAVNSQWDKKKLRDDPVIQSNKPGFVTFATSGKDSRTTQFFINTGDNSQLDSQGFSPFGKVIEGQDVVTSFCSRYGEQPDQDRIRRTGNEYLEREFPQLDAIVRATIES